MFYKVVYILISLGGVGPRTLHTPYVVTHTHNVWDLYINDLNPVQILRIFPNEIVSLNNVFTRF